MSEKTTTKIGIAENAICLDDARTWAERWTSDPINKVKAHLIPRIDITELFAEDGVVDIRAYIGIDDEGCNKLMLVGVDKDGNDLIDEEKGDLIYDFTKPCPDTCDIKSKLYT
jgi:hypothetical protein